MKKTIKTSLLGIILVCLASLVFCILEFHNASLMKDIALDTLQRPYKVSDNVSRMMIIITEARVELDLLGDNLSPDGIDRMESGLERKHAAIKELLAAIKAEYPGPAEYSQNLAESVEYSRKMQLYILRQARLSQNQEEVNRLIDNLMLPARRKLDNDAALLLDYPESEIRELVSRSEWTFKLSGMYAVVFFLIIVAASVLTFLTFYRQSKKLYHSNELFRHLSKSIDHVFLIYNLRKKRNELVSLNTKRILGIAHSVFKESNHPFRLYMGNEEAAELEAAVRAQTGNLPVEREFSFTDEHGASRWLKSTVYQASDEEGTEYYIVVISDLTKSKRAYQDLQEALHVAQKSGEAKQNFLSRMSHEIRTPMNAIIGMATIAATAPGNVDKVKNCLEKILLASRHLLMLINDVLDMSKIDAGNMHLTHDPFELSQVLGQVNALMYPQAEQKNIQFEMILKDVTEEKLVGDILRLKQILINLLSNAIKFTPEGGRVTLEIRQLVTRDSSVRMRFTVADTGIGIDPEFMPHLFDPFEQSELNNAQQFGGTGLGLCITKNLITLCGGFISVDSRLGHGTTFTVELDFELSGESPKVCLNKLPELRVLVVDDDRDCCEHTALVLHNIGVRSSWVLGGEEAVKIVAEAHATGDDFDVCFIDWRMPGMDGLETTRRIRALVGTETLIIIISAYDWSQIDQSARAAGADGFISKPLFQSNIHDTLLSITGSWATGGDSSDEASAKHPSANSTPDFSGKRVLLVEDNLINSEIAQEMLRQTGVEVETAEDGELALEKFMQSGPGYYDLILMDVQMPRMDGYACARAIRSSSRADAAVIPIVAMTANAFSEDVSEALASGMNDHVAKPIDLQVFYATLRNFLKGGEETAEKQSGAD